MYLRYLLIGFIFLSTVLPAQLKRADRFFKQNRLYRALPLYLKASKKADTKQEAYLKLAECYRLLNEYEKSEAA